MATATIDELEVERDRRTIRAMDDETLVYVMLGLNYEVKGAPGWGKSDRARVMSRLVFSEIAERWIPPDVLGAAFRQLGIGEVDDA